MNHQNQPELTLGPPPEEIKKRIGQVSARWQWLRLLLQIAVLICLLLLLARPANHNTLTSPDGAGATADDLREVASQLEEKSLAAEAARAWDAYLEVDAETPDRAELLYRVGKLHMQAEQYSDAVTALVRAKVEATGDAKLSAMIGERMVECLRRMGRYGEVERELSRQVEVGAEKTGRGKVLATMAGAELTEADLDRMIERMVERMLAAQGLALDSAARDTMLKRFADPQMRQQMLQQLLQTELFSRRAREPDMQLDRRPDFRQARQFLEENLLASRFLARQLESIRTTEVDIDAYYKANLERYREPESAEIQWFEVKAEEDATLLLATIESVEKFREIVIQRRGVDGNLPPARRVVRGQPDRMLAAVDQLFELDAEQWTKQVIEGEEGKYLVLVEGKAAARTPPLDEIKQRVQADYNRIKQQQLSEQLLRDLMIRYDVKLMPQTDQPADSADEAREQRQEETN
jgi:peptidyl-prolyl cis-trans isomerase C